MANTQSCHEFFQEMKEFLIRFFPFAHTRLLSYKCCRTSVVVSMHSHFAFRCIFHRFSIMFFFYLSKINIHHRKSSSIFGSALIAFMHLIEIALLRKLRWKYKNKSGVKNGKINKLQKWKINTSFQHRSE